MAGADHEHSHDHGHPHDHGHGHAHDHAGVDPSRLTLAASLNVGFAVIQVAVGLALASIAVLADALHQVVDAVGLVMALVAVRMSRRPADDSMSFGWGKADALGGYTSGLLLLASVLWIVWEAIERLQDPIDVSGGGVVAIGIAGILVNGFSLRLLGHGDHLSLEAARLHLLVDLAGSVIVVVAGAVLAGTDLTWADPVASLLINVLVLSGLVGLLRRATGELLDRSPATAGTDAVRRVLLAHDGVREVHHVHARSLGPNDMSVTAHVVLDGSLRLHDAQTQLDELQAELATRLGVHHATIQLECHECDDAAH